MNPPATEAIASKAQSGRPTLPRSMHVFVRDWLSSNTVVLKDEHGHVVIDSGYHLHAPLILQLLESRWGVGEGRLDWLVNTHCHSDHIGGNAAIQERFGCKIAVPAGEAALLDPWDPVGLLLTYADQYAPPFRFDRTIAAGDTNRWGSLDWEALAAPGHDMGALMFYNRENRILITGDALWENGFGFVFPREVDPACLPATRATLDLIAGLGVAVVIPGHGEPFADARGALEHAYSRLAALEADPARNARHIMKAMLAFALLGRRRMRLDALPGYCGRVPIFGDLNRRFLGLADGALADLLSRELERAGAAQREGEWLVTAAAVGH
jgi:glyoxylase-like metal-dependent hydrolase (beta-lactamase superfamily II)